MTYLAVSIMAESLDQALGAAVRAAERGADLVEFRIDRMAEDPTVMGYLVGRSPLPCIITCRPSSEGGEYEGDERGRATMFEHASAGGRQPAYFDVELAAYQSPHGISRTISRLVDHPGQVDPTNTGLILSTHDFTGRPVDLYRRIETMASTGACRVIKVVWHARSLRDNLEAFEILIQRHKPTIALCMGEAGVPSRVLAKKFGALLTFAALDHKSVTAPGQLTIDDLKNLYRWDAIDGETRVYGVIGYPVSHSMSPAIHNAGFDAIGHNGVYLPMPIPSEYEHFKATVASWLGMAKLHFRGASVTIPHKENLLRFVREADGQIEPLAGQIGAANTLTVREDGSLYASNTDYAGALDAVCDHLNIAPKALVGWRVAVIGAGGVARAVVAGFAGCGATVVVYNRTLEKAQALAQRVIRAARTAGIGVKVVAAPLHKLCNSCCQLFINCTPVGMHPNINATPIPPALRPRGGEGWGPGTVVFDTVYNPVQTRLLRDAREAGCHTISGTEMFIRQAAAQFRQWTGRAAPLDIFRNVLQAKLGS